MIPAEHKQTCGNALPWDFPLVLVFLVTPYGILSFSVQSLQTRVKDKYRLKRLNKNNTDREGIQEQQIQETPGCPDPLLLSWRHVLLQYLMSFGCLFTLLIFFRCFCFPICLQCFSDFASVCLVFILVSLCSLCPLSFLFWLIHFPPCLLCLEFPPL